MVCDITRPVPNAVVLPPIIETLQSCGIPAARITILIATGTHRASTEAEIVTMLGNEVLAKGCRIVNHICTYAAAHRFLGATPNGIPVSLDTHYLDADLKITCGLIEPHFMAGYSGGRKMVMPGVAALETIQAWHSPRFLEHPNATNGITRGNPVHEENTRIARMAPPDLIVDVVLDTERRITGVFAGEMARAWEAGVEFVEKRARASVAEAVDIVVTTSAGWPLDLTYYQTVKGMVGALPVVKPGGHIIIASACTEGIGGADFTRTLLETDNLETLMTQMQQPDWEPVPDQWQVEELAKAVRANPVVCVTDGIADEMLTRLFAAPAADVESAVAGALAIHGPASKIAVIPQRALCDSLRVGRGSPSRGGAARQEYRPALIMGSRERNEHGRLSWLLLPWFPKLGAEGPSLINLVHARAAPPGRNVAPTWRICSWSVQKERGTSLKLSVRSIFQAALVVCAFTLVARAFAADVPTASGPASDVKTANGVVTGTADPGTGVRVLKGIPYAQPPVGDLRWKAPQPVKDWTGARPADAFGPRAMQLPLFGDMVFRSSGMSEDCLYLNVWTPAKSDRQRLPVLVYFFGGGFVGGDGSEPRYDGESMARRGIVAVTVTFRLGVFGFLAHPELTRESARHASGNYGLMDQSAALRWVQKNIAAFGGDPKRVTIAGESAGSFSVSAQMASPWSKNLIAGAIGESGSLMGTRPVVPLAAAESRGVEFAAGLGATTLTALRALPAAQILEATGKRTSPRFGPIVDGDFLPRTPGEIYAAGQQAHVPLLVGWNSQESDAGGVLGKDAPTPENLAEALRMVFGDRADDAAQLYPASTDEEARLSATALAGDRVHCLQHLEVVRPAKPDRGQAGLPLLLFTASSGGIGRGAFGGNRVRAG